MEKKSSSCSAVRSPRSINRRLCVAILVPRSLARSSASVISLVLLREAAEHPAHMVSSTNLLAAT
jgi:hypothetical protein